MSKREEIRQRRQAEQRRTQGALVALVVVIALGITSYFIYENTRPVGEIVKIEKRDFPFANGKVLGAPEATVVLTEFSDYQ